MLPEVGQRLLLYEDIDLRFSKLSAFSYCVLIPMNIRIVINVF